MTDQGARAVAQAETRAVVIRNDGSRIDVGIVSAYYSNPLRRIWWQTIGQRAAARRIRRANRTGRS